MTLEAEDTKMLTVAEAAAILGVTPATLRRRMIRGTIAGYRDAAKHLIIRRSDVILASTQDQSRVLRINAADGAWVPPGRLTPTQRAQGLQAICDLRRLHAAIMAERGGEPLAFSALELLDESREERMRQLG